MSALGFGTFFLLISPLGHRILGTGTSLSPLREAALHRIEKRAAEDLRNSAVPEPAPADYALPMRLEIPRLGVDAAVENVGLAADGTMGVPASPDTVAWYKLGPRPGNAGSAVIAGHSGYKGGIPAVFDHLTDLRTGDLVFVEDAKGTMIRFVVRESRLYARDANAKDVFGPNDGHHLNLVACTGSWDSSAGTHAQRIVVFADAKP